MQMRTVGHADGMLVADRTRKAGWRAFEGATVAPLRSRGSAGASSATSLPKQRFSSTNMARHYLRAKGHTTSNVECHTVPALR